MRKVLQSIILLTLLATSASAEKIENLVRQCGPAVVVFRSADGDTFGSGVLVSPDGIVLTAEHLFADNGEFSVELVDGRKLPVERFIYRDEDVDLAALEVTGTGLPHVRLGDSKNVPVGSQVLAIGNPLGFENTVSQGIVSGKRVNEDDLFTLQTTAAISPGSSGGGLFNDQGQLIGITIEFVESGQNLNFAVPVHYADLTSLRSLDAQIGARPADAKSYLDRARAYLELGEHELGLLDVKKALQLDSQSAEAYRLRGEIYYRQDRNEDSLQDFTTVVQFLDDAQSYFDRGYTYLALDRYDEAVADFEVAIAKDPAMVDAYRGLANAFWWAERYVDAAKAWTGALNLEPQNPRFLASRGECYFFAEDYEAATKDLLACTKIDGDAWEPHFYGGRILLAGNEPGHAVSLLSYALELKPDDGSGFYYRALAYNDLQDYEAALEDLNQAVAKEYDGAHVRRLRGHVYYNLGRYERAATEYTSSLEMDPEQWDVLVDRGDAYAGLGDTEAATADYRRVLQGATDPELVDLAKEKLATLK